MYHIEALIAVIVLIAAVYIIENVVALPEPLGLILTVLFYILIVILIILIILIVLDYAGISTRRR